MLWKIRSFLHRTTGDSGFDGVVRIRFFVMVTKVLPTVDLNEPQEEP